MVRLKARSESNGFTIPQRVHLIGAGGMHMSAIGQILLARGHIVTGSDIAASEHVERLRALGATIYEGHAASNLGRAELVVTTVAARDDNPELLAALSLGVPVLVRAEMVQKLIADRDVLAVAGTHGKTTTTTLLAWMTVRGGLDPLVLAGGDSREIGSNARDGAGRLAVVEADEYAEAFLQYEPRYALILNVEADHLDYYGTEERFVEAFRAFSKRVQPEGTLFVSADSPYAAEIGAERAREGRRVERFALGDSEAEWRASQLRGNDRGGLDFLVQLDGAEVGRMSLQVPGRHNVSNALGALAVAMRAGVDFHRAAQAAAEFTGAHRRFEHLADVAGVTLMDDYAHHPTEVRATLQSARARFPGRRLVACFQPHTYSRSRYLLDGFRSCFESLDRLYILGTYAARETSEAGLSAQELAAEIKKPAPTYVETFEEAAERIASELQPGDVFFTIGAGNVDALGPMVRQLIEARP
ncbi:MAG: UDP-N-acetylmuramate--L-alanine ligase [Dehalococcoidia bacterium]